MSDMDQACNLEKETRRLFHEIHRRQDDNDKSRFRNAITHEFLGVSSGYFDGRVCVDLGCGSMINGAFNLLELGAKFVYAMDVDESFKTTAKQELESNPKYSGRVALDAGLVEELPYENEKFDFVLFQGVLHHLLDGQKGLDEAYRVMKKGAGCFLEVHGCGGVMGRVVLDSLRVEYKTNKAFASFIDDDNALDIFDGYLEWIKSSMANDESEAYQKSLSMLELLRDLIDKSFLLTVRDRLYAPLYNEFTYDQLGLMIEKSGFSDYRRIYRTPHYKNIRKLFAPLYGDPNHPLSKMLYGEGTLLVFVTK